MCTQLETVSKIKGYFGKGNREVVSLENVVQTSDTWELKIDKTYTSIEKRNIDFKLSSFYDGAGVNGKKSIIFLPFTPAPS